MNGRRIFGALSGIVLFVAAVPPAFGLANRVFVSARSGNDANSCDNVLTPCQTFAGAVVQLNPGGEAIVLDSGGYGPVTITQSLAIEAPPGVTAFIHPPSGDAITVNAGTSDVVTLRGLVLTGGVIIGLNNGVMAASIGTLNVEDCFITGFEDDGILMYSPGRLNVKGTSIKDCNVGIELSLISGAVHSSVDDCHLDANATGFLADSSGGSTTTTATYSTANNNSEGGWHCGFGSSGQDVLTLEFCTGSANGLDGIIAYSGNLQSAVRYSNCVFANNGGYGVYQGNASIVETRGNNTITGNGLGATSGTIGSFSAM